MTSTWYICTFCKNKNSRKIALYIMPVTWNEFDLLDIKDESNRNRFKKELKKFLLSNLSDTAVCNRVTCPACSRAP